MRCPRCSFEGEMVDGACPNCGYRRVDQTGSVRGTSTSGIRPNSSSGLPRPPSGFLGPSALPQRAVSKSLRSPSGFLSSSLVPQFATSLARPFSLASAKAGDLLNQGRYRLVDRLVLPDNQAGQGVAWLAIDTRSSAYAQVVLREFISAAEDQESKKQQIRSVALRLSEIAQHPGFPKVVDVFNEQDSYFIVLQHIEGESLASLLRRQGGALPERTVAEYGRQLCEMLTILARQQPPMVHGAISPETVIISPDRGRVHLIHMPLLPTREPANTSAVAGYKAPEQARGIADPASDLYAVAATMHHAVTGFDPRERIAFFYPPARRLNPVVSQPIETILAQELRLSALQRYARAADMQKDLAAFISTAHPEEEKTNNPISFVGDPLKLDMLELRRRSRQRNIVQLSVFTGTCLLILFGLLFFIYIYPLLQTSARGIAPTPTPNPTATAVVLQTALANQWKAEEPDYTSKGIGLSDGRYVFDVYEGRPAAALNYKKQAAQALLKGDLSGALNTYQQAVTQDPTDGEARIYYEDLQIAIQNDPYITIVLGLPIDKTSADLAISRPDLQSAFAFQDYANAHGLLPDGLKLRILLANSGAENKDVATVAQFIAQRVQIGNLDRIVAVVGWPKSGESANAIPILTAAKIPMISQTASSTALDSISPYFFRVNPNDSAQGIAEGAFAYNDLKARNVLVLRDPDDTYSQSLADAFTKSFKQLGGTVINGANDLFKEGVTTVEEYEKGAVTRARLNHVDLIFLPGFDQDAIRLAHAVGLQAAIYPFYLSDMKILGGDGFDSGLILGNGTGADAVLARTFPQDIQRLVFTSFSSISEWNKVPKAQQPEAFTIFSAQWDKLYGLASASNPDPPAPISTAIMVNDALGTFVYAINLVKGSLSGETLHEAIVSLGSAGVEPYKGISGPIAFGKDGNAVDKAVVLLSVAPDSKTGKNSVQLLRVSGQTN